MISQVEPVGSPKSGHWDGMNRMLDNLLKILQEETGLYGSVLDLAQREKDAIVGSNLDALREVTDRKASLFPRIQDLEGQRQAVIEDLAGALGRPTQELNLRNLSQLAGEPYASRLIDCRSHLLGLATSISEISSHNRELITYSLELVRSSFSFLNNLTVLNTVYHSTGKMLDSNRNGRVLSDEL